MKTITNIDQWLGDNVDDDIENIYSAWQAGQGESERDFTARFLPNGALIITGPGPNPLFLTPNAQPVYLSYVEKLNPHPDMTLHGALMYVREMRKQEQ
ncbi:hypothetical protein FY036_03425 [Mesorhizobium microcysteis]|uniref:Uncharacterized protein n=1 Tax=Neoaquamicrobium microcysteis TaxID=2682781 RepID=A0A5D4H2Y8_9HYPH|nr:hypothetical protein [Mesorhizobium microcysteis]TYR34884.1 hypothetical protein FY036_03425 [Mesorhizobium microcysteis]